MKFILYNFLKVTLMLILPFIILIRGAVFLHEHYHFLPWFSITGGILGSGLIICIYILFIHGRFTGKLGNIKTMKFSYWIALILVLTYCFPALLFLSNTNSKHTEVQKEFTSLHPILRLGISTVVQLDKGLIVTDSNRIPEDYRKMGLPTKSHSLHFKQSDGFSHAIDIRVKGRSEVRNWLLERYFRMMGFNTLRHFGTADHLHVSLLSHDRPHGI
ncbi:MAG: hypothetical protein P1U70_26645 [Saprospiraceae bacterium]|nr:hypothetical protein [Saprospiraceae bacterium]